MILLPKIYGTCKGSLRAINLATSVNEEAYMYNEVLHNNEVIDLLKSKGIEYVEDINDIPKDKKVILRAHGEGKSTYDYFERNNNSIVDTTCLNVVRIHDLVDKKSSVSYSIIIIGKKNHPEVIGTLGWTNGLGIVIEDEDDINKLKNLNKDILVVGQTTMNEDKYDKMCKIIKNKYKDSNVEVINTICGAQKLIQNSSIEIAKKVKYMFVIGGQKSSNTRELYNKCNKYTKSFLVSSKNDFFTLLNSNKFRDTDVVGFTAGASTLKEKVDEYINIYKFYTYYCSFKKKIDKKISNYNKTITKNIDNNIIKDNIELLSNMNSGGKNIRSFLIDLGYNINGKEKDYSIDLGVAYELFESAILVHDDIIDEATTRRGKKTIPYTFKDKYDNNNALKVGNDIALCLGDYGFYKTFELIINKYKNNKNFNKLLSYYVDIVLSTIRGEILDVYLPFYDRNNKSSDVKLDNIMEIYKEKTAHYTLIGPFTLGLILGGSSDVTIKKYNNLLLNLGLAFQIKDDILGVFSDKNVIGKDTNDITEYKETILYYYTVNSSYKDKLLKYYGKNIDEKDLEEVRNIFIESKSLDKATEVMNDLIKKSREELDNIKMNKDIKDILYGFMDYLFYRSK